MARSTRYVALLRSVNVGGRRVPMAELRSCLSELGLQDVRTYLQSGNAVFDSPSTSAAQLRRRVETALAAWFGFEVPTIVITAAEIAAVVAQNPYPQLVDQPTRLVVSFLPDPVAPDLAARFDLSDFPESAVLRERVLYLHYPNGQGESKLTPAVLQRRLGEWGTARNWRTVLALDELANR